MNIADDIARERRARLAAERMLELKQAELFEANSKLSRHALALSDQFIEKREEAEDLKDQNTQVRQDLEVANHTIEIAERRLWDSVETIQDGFAVFDANSVLIAANSAYLSVFDGMECVVPGITYPEIADIMVQEGIVNIGDTDPGLWRDNLLHRWTSAELEPRTIKLWNSQFIKLIDRRASDGDTVSLALNITDTIRKEKQLTQARGRAEAASRAKSAFLAKMSHELRTPMNGVVGMAQLLGESEIDDEQRLYVETIKSSGEALLELINDVLDFSKIEAAKLTLHKDEFDLETTLRDVIMLFRPAVVGKDVELLLDYDLFLPTRFVGDSGRVRQVLTNLVGNAVKFTAEGHVLIRVTGVPADNGEDFDLHIAVEDTGIGIPPEMAEHIFGEFNQVEDEKNRKFEGTGLGLAITKQLVELMGGRIWVEGDEGKGSCFGFTLPMPAPGVAGLSRVSAPQWLRRVLLVDARQPAANMFCHQLGTLGIETVMLARDAAPFDLTAQPGDVVLLDARRMSAEDPVSAAPLLAHIGDAPLLALHGGGSAPLPELGRPVVPLGEPLSVKNLIETLNTMDCSEPPGDVVEDTGVLESATLEPAAVDDDLNSIEAPVQNVPGARIAPADPDMPVVDVDAPPPAAPAPIAELAVHNPDPLGNPPVANPVQTADIRKMRILAAEDNKTNRLVFSKLVKALNIDLEFAENGLEAVEKWQSFQPDLIFMDISMPEMDGKEATQEIRNLEAAGNKFHTPIVALTAHAMQGDDAEILAAGLDFYLTKPLRKPAIFDRIKVAKPDECEDVFPIDDEARAVTQAAE